MSRQKIKAQAKELMKDKSLWLALGTPALIITLITALLQLGDNQYGVITSALSILVILWEIGVAGYITAVIREGYTVEDDFFGQIKGIVSFINGNTIATYAWTILFLILWALIPIAGIVLVIVKGYSYGLAIYLSLRNELHGKEAITESRHRMMGYKGDWFVLNLSFIGWLLLVIVTGGLASIYVTPYIYVTEAIYANEILDKTK